MDAYDFGPREQLLGADLERLRKLGGDLRFYDLGASGGTPPPFCDVPELLYLVNFEPHKALKSAPNGQTLPVAIGPSRATTLHMNVRPTTSSLLPANSTYVNRYDFQKVLPDDPPDIFRTVETCSVETVGLDAAIARFDLAPPDFIKIDVQGLTHEVLESARSCLAQSVLGLQIEVEFGECYQGQRTFGVVHELLHSAGFEIFEQTNLNSWFYRTSLKINRYKGQHTFCDFLYLRSIDSVSKIPTFWTPERCRKMIQIALLHNLTDVAAAFFERLREQGLLGRKQEQLKAAIESWGEQVPQPSKSLLDRCLDTSPRRLLNRLRRSVSDRLV